jgi:hypothetical protein
VLSTADAGDGNAVPSTRVNPGPSVRDGCTGLPFTAPTGTDLTAAPDGPADGGSAKAGGDPTSEPTMVAATTVTQTVFPRDRNRRVNAP